MSKAKKRLKNFDFSGENAAVALVHEAQGGPANNTKTLVMKSTDVVVELSMAEFLTRFFGIWSGDAAFIAKILGMSDDTEALWNYEELEERVTILKKVKESTDSGERFPLDMGDLSDLSPEEFREATAITKALAAKTNFKITDIDEFDVVKNADGVSEAGKSQLSEDKPVSENVETPIEEINKMSENVEMIEKSVAEAQVAEEIRKATEAKDAELEELRKSLKAFEDEKVEIQKAQFVEKAKGFEVLGVEDFEGFGVALMKMAGDESLKAVTDALEKAVNIAKAQSAGEFEEQGHGLDADSVSGVEAVLKARGKIK